MRASRRGDWPVAVISHDEAHGHYAVAQVVDAEDRFFFLGVVRLGSDRHFFFVVHFDCGE
jgi:hypothetical protein